MIVFQKVTKEFRGRTVLADLSFRVEPREFVCVTGPSGAGKTTILSLLIGAAQPTAGTVEVDGVDLRRVPPPALQLYRRRVGFIFQDGKLVANRTVAENVGFPLEVCGVPDGVLGHRVEEVLKWTGLTDRADALPHHLSGGEKARVALARAVVHKPLIILADEPTGNVDPEESIAILTLLQAMRKEGTTVILATHDAVIVDTLQTRVLRLEHGKLIRDSWGGYDKAKRVQPKTPAAAGEHRVFTDTDAQVVAEIEGQGQDGGEPPPPEEEKQKVRITPIGS